MWAFFFSVDPQQAHLQSHLFLINSPSTLIPLQLVLGVTFHRILSFSTKVFSLKGQVFAPNQRLTRYLCFLMRPHQNVPLSFVQRFSSGPHLCFTRMVSFLWRCQRHKLDREANHGITSCLSSSPIPFLLTENSLPLLRVTPILPCLLRSGPFVSQLSFSLQV